MIDFYGPGVEMSTNNFQSRCTEKGKSEMFQDRADRARPQEGGTNGMLRAPVADLQNKRVAQPLELALRQLADGRERLSHLVKELSERLNPVLRPIPQSTGGAEQAGNAPTVGDSPVVRQIQAEAEHLFELSSWLGNTMDRIEF